MILAEMIDNSAEVHDNPPASETTRDARSTPKNPLRERIALGIARLVGGVSSLENKTEAQIQGDKVAAALFALRFLNLFPKTATGGGIALLATACAGMEAGSPVAAAVVEQPTKDLTPESYGYTVTPTLTPQVEKTSTSTPEPVKQIVLEQGLFKPIGESSTIGEFKVQKMTLEGQPAGGGGEVAPWEKINPFPVSVQSVDGQVVGGYSDLEGNFILMGEYKNNAWLGLDGQPFKFIQPRNGIVNVRVEPAGLDIIGTINPLEGIPVAIVQSNEPVSKELNGQPYHWVKVVAAVNLANDQGQAMVEGFAALELFEEVENIPEATPTVTSTVTETVVPTETPVATATPTETIVPTATKVKPTATKAAVKPTVKSPEASKPKLYIAQSPIPLYSSASGAETSGNFMPGTGNTFKVVKQEGDRYYIATFGPGGSGDAYYFYINKGDLAKAVVTAGGTAEKPTGVGGTYKIQGENPNPNRGGIGGWGEAMSWLLFGNQERHLSTRALIVGGNYQIDASGNINKVILEIDVNEVGTKTITISPGAVLASYYANDPKGMYKFGLNDLPKIVKIGDQVVPYFVDHSVPQSGIPAPVLGAFFQ